MNDVSGNFNCTENQLTYLAYIFRREEQIIAHDNKRLPLGGMRFSRYNYGHNYFVIDYILRAV